MLKRLLRRVGWLLGIGTPNGEGSRALKVIDEIRTSRPLAEDTQFMMLMSANKDVQRKIEACTDILDARIRAEEEHLGT